MSPRLFGTDGIRARFGEPPLVEPVVRRLGAAIAAQLAGSGAPALVLLGGDTRASGPALAGWIGEGLAVGGASPIDLGVLPTAAVARLVPARGARAGVVLSASHNPAADNGIKVIGADGFKWSDAQEQALEERLALDARAVPSGAPAATARAADPTGRRDYLDALVGAGAGARPLGGLRVALDCAHGAASGLAAELFERLGARVEALFDAPDGENINRDCGSTHPERLMERVAGGGFDLGFAFDGDADRALLVDERGALRDGDAMLVLWARELLRTDPDAPRAIVATSMSNLGLERALAGDGIDVVRCDVGDRAVVATLRARGLRLGGEQSGHLVDLARSTTGDGLLTASVLAGVVARAGRPVSELLAAYRRYPQLIQNVRVRAKPDLASLPAVADAAREVERRLGADGRLVLRYSGTEPLARVMIEGPDEATVRELADRVASAIRAAIGD